MCTTVKQRKGRKSRGNDAAGTLDRARARGFLKIERAALHAVGYCFAKLVPAAAAAEIIPLAMAAARE